MLDRQFDHSGPNEEWVADITCGPAGEGWLYAAIVDLFSRRVVGWTITDRMESRLGVDALDMAAG